MSANFNNPRPLKFIYSEKATNFCEISTVDLSYIVTVKSMLEISQNFVAYSEYMNFSSTKFALLFIFSDHMEQPNIRVKIRQN